MRFTLLLTIFISLTANGAQGDCVSTSETHFDADMPAENIQWDFIVIDESHTRANLTIPRELNGAVFFQAVAQKEDIELYEYAFPLEAVNHPLTTQALEIEFIMQNAELALLSINLIYLEEPYLECSNKKSFSYRVQVP